MYHYSCKNLINVKLSLIFSEVVLCFLGQQIFDEIVDSNRHVCPMENMDIALPLYDPYFHSNITHSIPYHRSRSY